jgi:hypothetical protein
MATTYDRIRLAATRLARRSSWDIGELAEDLRAREQPEFRIRGDGTSPNDFMSVGSIRRLIRLMADLGLADRQAGSNNKIKISDTTQAALAEDDTFALEVKSCVRSYLYTNGVGINRIKAVASAIRFPPELPDADTIFEKLSEEGDLQLSESLFRKLIYLYASAGGAERVVAVYYTDIT